jgi:hypothetical protein
MNKDLPQGWESTTINNLFDFKYGKGLPKEKRNNKGLIKVYGSNGIVGVHDDAFCRGPAIIVGRKGSVGEVHLSMEPCWPIDTTYFIDEFHSNMPPQYWALCLKSLRLGKQEKSSAIPGISRDDIYEIEVPVPPLNEQRRIIAKLEKLLDKVDACQKRLEKIPAILKRFRQSVLAAACSGRLTQDWREKHPDAKPISFAIKQLKKGVGRSQLRRGIPESVPVPEMVSGWELPPTWEVFSAAELLRSGAILDLKDGNHGANHPKVSDFTDDGLPFITAAQVHDFCIDYENAYKVSGAPLKKLKVGFAKFGDVIYTHKGSVGRVAIADKECVLTPQTT